METPNEKKFNPYRPPETTATAPSEAMENAVAAYIPDGRTVTAGEGLEWLVAAWRLFVAAPVMWMLMVVLYAVFMLVLAFVPVVGTLMGFLLYGVITAGWLAGATAVAHGEKLELDHLFAGLKGKPEPLFVLGAFYAAGLIAITLLVIIALAVGLASSVLVSTIMSGSLPDATALLGALVVVLLGLALVAPLMAALWFAPALVYFHDVRPTTALKVSFIACLKNWLPFLVYGVPLLMLFLLAAIPFGLGLLVVGPLAFISGYTSYRSVFTDGA